MKKLALLSLLLALAATTACSRPSDTAVNSAGNSNATDLEVNLAEGGLSTGQRGLHHLNILTFGLPRDRVIADISAALGRPTATGRNAECPSGPVDYASFGALDLHFEEGRFVGWVIDEAGGPEIESYQGLTFGQLRSELGGDSEVTVDADSTLGTELSVDGIGVLMSGPGQSARVTNLFSGTTCFAR